MITPSFTVSEFIEICNQNLEYSYPQIVVEGEVANYKVNQGKWVFFDLKDDTGKLSCFIPLFNLSVQIADGMRVRVQTTPKLTRWGSFSLTVTKILPVGEGSIKKSFELLKAKLAKEGLFAPEKKRPLPTNLSKLGVISSTGAAGYIDFLRILDNRWGGLDISTVNTQVQGIDAPSQIVRALDYFNQRAEVEVIAIIRGGGSADDLSAFNDEELVRAIAASRIPVITGIGHEIDESLADLAADVRASTPSNAAERLVPDRQAMRQQTRLRIERVHEQILAQIERARRENREAIGGIKQELSHHINTNLQHIQETVKLLDTLSPEKVLERGYAIVRGKLSPGEIIEITTATTNLTAEVKNAKNRI